MSIPDYTVSALRRHQFASAGLGGAWVFCNEAGHHYDLSAARKAWKRDTILANANLAEEGSELRLPEIRLYGARHTHLTHLLMLGVHPKVAGDRAGHSSISVTMDTYSHVLPEVDRLAGDKIGTLLFAGGQ